MMRKTIAIYSLMIALLAFSLISSCTEGFIPEEEIDPTLPIGDTITYVTHISTIMTNSCISCHGGSNPQGNLLLETYNQVRNSAENGTLIQRINDVANPMPPAGLMPASTRALLDEWVQNGYLEN